MNTIGNEKKDKLVKVEVRELGSDFSLIWLGYLSQEKLDELCVQADKLSDESVEEPKTKYTLPGFDDLDEALANKNGEVNLDNEELDKILAKLDLYSTGVLSPQEIVTLFPELQEAKAQILKHYTPNSEIERIVNETRIEENSRCIEIMKDVFAENFHYRIMCGEIKDPTGKIDVNKAFIEYQELEPERMKFAQYIEKRTASKDKKK